MGVRKSHIHEQGKSNNGDNKLEKPLTKEEKELVMVAIDELKKVVKNETPVIHEEFSGAVSNEGILGDYIIIGLKLIRRKGVRSD